MTTQPPGNPSVPNYQSPSTPQRQLSKSSLLSLICGVLGCVPFATGGLAILLGIIGFIRTGNPLKKGRWMAVVGLLLGLVSIAGWAVFFGGGALLLWKGTEAPRVAAHDFIKDVASGDMAAARNLEQGFNDGDMDNIQQQIIAHGKFLDTAFGSFSVTNDACELSGTAKFDTGVYNLTVKLNKLETWKVTSILLDPDKR